MALPTFPNTITANDINVELGKSGTTSFAINDSDNRALANKPGSGTAIAFSDFFGSSLFDYAMLAAFEPFLSSTGAARGNQFLDPPFQWIQGIVEPGFLIDGGGQRINSIITLRLGVGVGQFGISIGDELGSEVLPSTYIKEIIIEGQFAIGTSVREISYLTVNADSFSTGGATSWNWDLPLENDDFRAGNSYKIKRIILG